MRPGQRNESGWGEEGVAARTAGSGRCNKSDGKMANNAMRAGGDGNDNRLDWAVNFATKVNSRWWAADDGWRTADDNSRQQKKRHGRGGGGGGVLK